MFIGHFGVGFAAKSLVPKVSLGTLFLAVQYLDLLWPTFGTTMRLARVGRKSVSLSFTSKH